ncbi:Uncharacterised protein [Mycobacterium tuberculosis]|nr:Uncharacterised protein [Mycobacterium tuberculosis]
MELNKHGVDEIVEPLSHAMNSSITIRGNIACFRLRESRVEVRVQQLKIRTAHTYVLPMVRVETLLNYSAVLTDHT